MRFRNRQEAGRLLAKALKIYKGMPLVVYALPRGGVVLGAEIAKRLQTPLDLVVPRKVGHPDNPEYAVCAVTEDGHLVCSKEEVAQLDPEWLAKAIKKEQAEARRRHHQYLTNQIEIMPEGKIAIIVDDGIATGLTMLAAVQEVKSRHPAKVFLAAPIIPRDVAEQLERYVDGLIALEIPGDYLGAVGAYYNDFEPVEDEDVVRLVDSARA